MDCRYLVIHLLATYYANGEQIKINARMIFSNATRCIIMKHLPDFALGRNGSFSFLQIWVAELLFLLGHLNAATILTEHIR